MQKTEPNPELTRKVDLPDLDAIVVLVVEVREPWWRSLFQHKSEKNDPLTIVDMPRPWWRPLAPLLMPLLASGVAAAIVIATLGFFSCGSGNGTRREVFKPPQADQCAARSTEARAST
jgi:hypothetical protein